MNWKLELLSLIERFDGQKDWHGLAHCRPFMDAPGANFLFPELDEAAQLGLIEERDGYYWITAAGRKRLAGLRGSVAA